MSLNAIMLSLLPLVAGVPVADTPAELDPPEIRIGEALFLETRFAEYFATHATEINAPLEHGDPVMDLTVTPNGNLPGPFRGQSINCRACHLVDEFADQPGASQGGMRTYADFAQRSPIPHRADGLLVALRNSPSQVNASVDRDFTFFHSDGEFASMEDLVRGTLTGRNFGWLKGEEAQALAHVARVIREDDGKNPIAEEDAAFATMTYADLLRGKGSKLPDELKLPREYRIDVTKATNEQVMDAVAKLIAVYVTDLAFSQDEAGYNRSPYDAFLRKNHLPTKPDEGESSLHYSQRLLGEIEALEHPEFVAPSEGTFASHEQAFRFGEVELEGLKIFLHTTPAPGRAGDHASVGNCAACHPAPHFSDFRFHNTGATQEEYDAIHGAEAFLHVEIPIEKDRAEIMNSASGINPFADVPALEHPGHTDLGLWNVFLNPEFPKPQEKLMAMMHHEHPGVTDTQALLDTCIAAFKTAGLRDLGHSDPYFHTGRFNDLESAVHFYRQFSELARHGGVRNADPELLGVHIAPDDEAKLAALLRALNEDYE